MFSYQKKQQKLEETLNSRDEEIAQLQKKLKRHGHLTQQTFPCSKCTKNFITAELLESHNLRKHPPVQEAKDKDSNLINAIKLELEIKQLKERLNVSEKEKMMPCEKCLQNARRQFENKAIQSNFEEKEKDDFEKDEVRELLNHQMALFEEWKRSEESRNRKEIDQLRGKLDEMISTLKDGALRKEVQVNPPSPAPRRIVISEKCVGTSRSVETLIEPKPMVDEDLWKTRFEELEKTVANIEKIYSEKMEQLQAKV